MVRKRRYSLIESLILLYSDIYFKIRNWLRISSVGRTGVRTDLHLRLSTTSTVTQISFRISSISVCSGILIRTRILYWKISHLQPIHLSLALSARSGVKSHGPELWTMLLLWVPLDAPSPRLPYFCSTWLARSDGLPLSIRFKYLHLERGVDLRPIRMAIDILRDHSWHWNTMWRTLDPVLMTYIYRSTQAIRLRVTPQNLPGITLGRRIGPVV